jgi:DNA segregation ATPase FtsK/SpoIIIE-like protein
MSDPDDHDGLCVLAQASLCLGEYGAAVKAAQLLIYSDSTDQNIAQILFHGMSKLFEEGEYGPAANAAQAFLYVNPGDQHALRILEAARANYTEEPSRVHVSEVTADEEHLLEQCIEIMHRENSASSSLFQRRLKLAYTRAARIVDILEARGYIGPAVGARPRQILKP